MPYANFYIDNICDIENELHFVYWNRDLREEDTNFSKKIKLYEFKYKQEDQVAKFKKVKAFYKYRKFAIQKIKEINPDKIIILHTMPGVLLSRILAKKYNKEYLFDYRDSTYEKFKLFRNVVHKIVKNSKYTFCSSEAFKRFLPKDEFEKILISHNININEFEKNYSKENKINSEKIRIGFWGFIREEKLNRVLIEKISSDSRFELHYYGREQSIALNLKEFSKSINTKNVFFHGEYNPADRFDFAKNTDIIHNVYENGNMMLAVSNKYYDGIMFHLPQITMINSYMGQKVNNLDIGISIDPYNNNLLDDINKYYYNINKQRFIKACKNSASKIIKESYINIEKLKEFINGK